MNESDNALARRIEQLEDIEAIRRLKARYCNACDAQDPEAARNCFADGEVHIDMGHVGVFSHRDQFAELYRAAGCHDHILDMHHLANPEIEIGGAAQATGKWALEYRNINTQEKTVTFISALYHDRYVKSDGAWKICESRTEYRTALHCSYASGTLQTALAARSVAGVVDYPATED